MKSVVFVIQMRRPRGEWGDVHVYRLLEKACATFEGLTATPLPPGYSFRMVKRVTREMVLDSWDS